MVPSDAELEALRLVGDPLADDVVGALFRKGEIRRVNELMRALVENGAPVPAGLPEEVRDYLARDPLPADVDRARIERSERFFQVWGMQISMSLFCASLPSAYAAAKGVKVLFETARLQTDTRRRIFETGQFLMDVMAPGGLGPGGAGVRSAQRVRLMHAAVRHLLLADGNWDEAKWGLPINQEDLAGTLLSFSYVPIEPRARLGIAVSRSEQEDYLYTWSVIGEMLGVRTHVRPTTVEDATALVTAIRRRQYDSSPEGIAMTDALVTTMEQMTPHLGSRPGRPAHVRGLGRLVPVMIRHLIGDDVANMVAVPPGRPGWFRLLEPLLGLLRLVESDIEHDAHVKRMIEPFARAVLLGMFDHERGGTRPPFAIPDELARTWELSS